MRFMILLAAIIGLTDNAIAYTTIFPGQTLTQDSPGGTLSFGSADARRICDRFYQYCFGFNSQQHPGQPVLYRTSDNAITWCSSDFAGSSLNQISITQNGAEVRSTYGSGYGVRTLFSINTQPIAGSFRWMEIVEGGSIVLYESKVAFTAFKNSTLPSSTPPNYRSFITPYFQVEGKLSYPNNYFLEQIWDGPLVMRTYIPGQYTGQILKEFHNMSARYLQVTLDGDLIAFDADDSPAWRLPSPLMMRPAYWSVGDRGDLHLFQGREIARFGGSTPVATCLPIPTPVTPLPPGGGATASTPPRSQTLMTRLRVLDTDPPTTTPTPVPHPAPW